MASLPTVNGVPVVMPPPPGYVVDFENPQRNSVTEAYWMCAIGNFLCLLFILQRVYVRAVVQRTFHWEDVSLGVAYVFSVVLQALIVRGFARGILGIHSWEMPIDKFVLFLEVLYQLPILYNPVQCGAKLALLLLYRRLAPQMWYKITVWFVGFVVVGSSVAILFATIFPCNPVRSAWDLTITNGTCIDRPGLYQATAILGAITDLMVLAVPIPIVVTLQISRKQKIVLVAAFSIGGVTAFTSIMRLVALINQMGDIDQPWGGGPVLLWIFAETNLSIICGTLPTVRPLLSHIAPRFMGSSSNSNGQYVAKSGLSNPNATPTFGGTGGNTSRNRSKKYERFDDEIMYPLETIVAVEGADDHGSDAGHRGDSGSETAIVPANPAIVQTKTTTVSYESRH